MLRSVLVLALAASVQGSPTPRPSHAPTQKPTHPPTPSPTVLPSLAPSATPSDLPTPAPTPIPSESPTRPPTHLPSFAPSPMPSASEKPTTTTPYPSATPSMTPTAGDSEVFFTAGTDTDGTMVYKARQQIGSIIKSLTKNAASKNAAGLPYLMDGIDWGVVDGERQVIFSVAGVNVMVVVFCVLPSIASHRLRPTCSPSSSTCVPAMFSLFPIP